MKKTTKVMAAMVLVALIVGTFGACKRNQPASGTTTPSETALEWTENLPNETEVPTTVVGTDAAGNTQVYSVVTNAQGQTVTKVYTAPSGGNKATTTKKQGSTATTKKGGSSGGNKATTTVVNDDLPTVDNSGWGDWEDGSKTPFELKSGYDSYLMDWVNEGIGAVTGQGRSNHMDSPKSTLSDWAWDAVRSYANTGSMNWSGIMDHVEKNKEYFPNGAVDWKVSGRVAVSGFKGKTYKEAGRYIADQMNKQTGLKSKAQYWGGDGEDFLAVYQKGGYWYVIVGEAASTAWR